MLQRNQPKRWQAMVLIVIMAAAGWLFLLKNWQYAAPNLEASWHMAVQFSPAMLAVAAVGLILADQCSHGAHRASAVRRDREEI